MSKRFTDVKKWRNEWFRTLPIKAKLTWIYLCDECDYSGIWKADYGLASFQLGYTLTNRLLLEWFGDKLHFFDNDKVLIVQFFEFQYSSSKDTWTAKLKAKEKLEAFGFIIESNKLKIPNNHCPPTVGDPSPSVLIVGELDIDIDIKKKEDEKSFEKFWAAYPRRDGKTKSLSVFRRFVKTPDDLVAVIRAAENYAHDCTGKDPKFIKLPTTFLQDGYWREWVTRLSIAQPKADLSSIFGKAGA